MLHLVIMFVLSKYNCVFDFIALNIASGKSTNNNCYTDYEPAGTDKGYFSCTQ